MWRPPRWPAASLKGMKPSRSSSSRAWQGEALDDRRDVGPLDRLLLASSIHAHLRQRRVQGHGDYRVDTRRVHDVRGRDGNRAADRHHPAFAHGGNKRQFGGDHHPHHSMIVIKVEAEDVGRCFRGRFAALVERLHPAASPDGDHPKAQAALTEKQKLDDRARVQPLTFPGI